MMQKLDAHSFDGIVYDEGGPCLVMFSREDCHVCKSVHPKIEELAADEDYADRFGFYEVDVDEQRNLFQRFSLKGVPQVLFFDGGDYLGKLAGNKDAKEYEERIKDIIGS